MALQSAQHCVHMKNGLLVHAPSPAHCMQLKCLLSHTAGMMAGGAGGGAGGAGGGTSKHSFAISRHDLQQLVQNVSAFVVHDPPYAKPWQ